MNSTTEEEGTRTKLSRYKQTYITYYKNYYNNNKTDISKKRKDYYESKKINADWKEKVKERNRINYLKTKTKEDKSLYKEKQKEAQKRYRTKNKDDPDFKAEVSERNSLYRLKKKKEKEENNIIQYPVIGPFIPVKQKVEVIQTKPKKKMKLKIVDSY
jgi:hypothetical protein